MADNLPEMDPDSEEEMETEATEAEEALASALPNSDDDDDDDDDEKDDEDDDDDSDDDDDDDNESNEKIEQLESQLRQNPYLYDVHIQLITFLRESGELEKLRSARDNMHKYHPMTEQLWLDWLNDEVKLLNPDSDRNAIYTLFDKATEDYLSVQIWLEYVQFGIGGMGTAEGMQKCRDIFEKALTKVGLHVTKGANLWEAYREWEMAVLASLQPEMATSKNEAEIEAQSDRITNIFKRQLAVPLMDMKLTFREYRDWADDEGKSLSQIYQNTLQKLDKIRPFETKLTAETPPSISAYNEYLDFEIKNGEPARIVCLFERAIKDHCLEPELWLRYLTYLDDNLKSGSVTLPAYQRAIRNCSWNVDIWLRYIRAMERNQQDHNDIKGLFEQALGVGFTEAAPYLLLWTGYCDYLRRRVDWKNEAHGKELDIFRISIERGIQNIFQLFGNRGDPNCSLHQYWATIEARYCQNMTKSREIWNEIMTRGHGNEAKMWLEFLNLERSHGDAKHCRKLLQRAVNSVTDWPEAVCEAYINFEREAGTLEDYDLAVGKSKTQLERLQQRQQQQREKEELQRGKNKKGQFKPRNQNWNNEGKGRKPQQKGDQFIGKGQQQQQKGGQKRKQDEATEEPVAKATKTDDDSFKMPAAPSQEKAKKAPPPGYKAKQGPELPTPPTGENKTETDSEMKDAKSTETEDAEKTETTVFVSNLSYDVTEGQLRFAFEKCGEIKEIRIAMHKQTGKELPRSRGFAYVEFTNSVSVAAALSLDRTPLGKRPMFVSIYRSPSSDRAQFKYQVGLEKNKLFVNSLPSVCTKEALETIFSQHGALKSVRVVTNRAGASKGRAYVEFEKEEEAAQAILKTDGLMIGDNKIEVAISNPPPRRAPTEQRPPQEFTPTLGGGKKDNVTRKAHTMLAFTPRAIVKTTPVPPSGGAQNQAAPKPAPQKVDEPAPTKQDSGDVTEGSDEKPKMKSNADFRNLFLKK